MRSERKRTAATPFYRFARAVLTVFSAIFYPCTIINRQGADLAAPFVLLCNHQSMMDPVLLAVKIRQHEIHFIGKRELTRFLPLKWIVEHLHMIAVSRHESDLGAMRAAGQVLKSGHVLGIFPEGRRRHGPSMEEMESGVSLLAQRHRVPLLPVYIAGRPRPFHRVTMEVLAPIAYDDILVDGIDKEAGERLSRRIQGIYRDMDIKYSKKTIVM